MASSPRPLGENPTRSLVQDLDPEKLPELPPGPTSWGWWVTMRGSLEGPVGHTAAAPKLPREKGGVGGAGDVSLRVTIT